MKTARIYIHTDEPNENGRQYQLDGKWQAVPTNKLVIVPVNLAEAIQRTGDIASYEVVEGK